MPVDVAFARGTWLGLRWALGVASRPPVDVPIRRADGSLMNEVDMSAELLRRGQDQATAHDNAVRLVAYSRRLAAIVEDLGARLGC